MPKQSNHRALYEAATRFVDAALRNDDALFTPGHAIWSRPVINDLYARFVEHPDTSNDTFVDKFGRQLQDVPSQTVQLAGELLFVHLLRPINMGATAKRALIENVLSWSPRSVEILADLVPALGEGVGNIGTALTHRPFQLWFLLEFVQRWKDLDVEDRNRWLDDPYALKAFIGTVPGTADQVQREALLHLVHPDTFEPIVSLADKRRIAIQFADKIRVPDDDVDRQLHQIRESLTSKYGSTFRFYNPAIRALWAIPSPRVQRHPVPDSGPHVTVTSTLDRLAEVLLLPIEFLNKIDRLLRDKRQVIFYGPPGTGKTYVARQLADHYARTSSGEMAIVQFHPSYSYEDFVEDFRPRLLNGQPGFALRPGPLKLLTAAAAENPEGRHVLLIDEINRGNLAKVFGELYYLLEYRSDPIRLQYADEDDEPFSLPPNLWLIGTMNTADRSIALIDAALRRRFYFVPFFPDEWPIKGLLRRWLDRNARDLTWLADVVDAANDELGSRHAAIGPSYFMKTNLTEEQVGEIWEHAILPYVEEQRFGEERVRETFALDRLRRKARGEPTAAAAEGMATDVATTHSQ